MISDVLEEFKSWDEVDVGDELVWVTSTNKNVYRISFLHLDPDDGDGPGWTGKVLECPYETLEIEGGWSQEIYPTVTTFSNGPMGWKRIRRYMQYDPNQQGDLEDDL